MFSIYGFQQPIHWAQDMLTFELDGILRLCDAVLKVLPVTTCQSETPNLNQLRPVVFFEGRAYSKGMSITSVIRQSCRRMGVQTIRETHQRLG